MKFETLFQLSSYAMIACGVAALAVAGGLGPVLALALFAIFGAAWKFENSRWRLPERIALAAVLFALPLFYADWKIQTSVLSADAARAGINALVHFIIFLSLVKLWQTKADRDWLFLYLISFFEIVLAAGLSLSPSFVASLAAYAFVALTTVVCFEIRRARRAIHIHETRFVPAERRFGARLWVLRSLTGGGGRSESRRLVFVSLCLLLAILVLAAPVFFLTPRLSGGALARAESGLTRLVGFSDEVTIGEYGRLQQSERVVMRVRVDDPYAARNLYLRWRGVALDEFDGRTWRRSDDRKKFVERSERSLFQFDTADSVDHLTTQTFFIEPLDTPVLFAARRAVAVQGALPYVGRDREDDLSTRTHAAERISYRAYSDTTEPPLERLRADVGPYDREKAARYLQLPARLDPRIRQLAHRLVAETDNRYDAARVIESYFKRNFTYSLEMAAGGEDPLADFLFRVRAGHCEYFSTAMAVMLRSVNVAARVVNGFQMGEYNDAADVYTVRQSDAHSWVEVYFPETGAWVSFDPTPQAGRPASARLAGLRGQAEKYAEALEMFWIQYVVNYDRQEQRQLASTLRRRLGTYRQTAARLTIEWSADLVAWWHRAAALGSQTGRPFAAINIVRLVLITVAIGLFFVFARRRGFSFRRKLRKWRRPGSQSSAVAFYERMTRALAARGFRREPHQTPLEFAGAVGFPEAVLVTRAYNRVRFGAEALPAAESARVEAWLRNIEGQRDS